MLHVTNLTLLPMVERRYSRVQTVASRMIDVAESAQICGKGDLEKSVASLLDDLVSESISLDSYLEQCGGLLGLAFHNSTDDFQFREQQEQVGFLMVLEIPVALSDAFT